eukprot:30988-Pelagococcus_subviridis.AAC.3
MRRQKSLSIGVHHAIGVVWGPVYRTHQRVAVVRSQPLQVRKRLRRAPLLMCALTNAGARNDDASYVGTPFAPGRPLGVGTPVGTPAVGSRARGGGGRPEPVGDVKSLVVVAASNASDAATYASPTHRTSPIAPDSHPCVVASSASAVARSTAMRALRSSRGESIASSSAFAAATPRARSSAPCSAAADGDCASDDDASSASPSASTTAETTASRFAAASRGSRSSRSNTSASATDASCRATSTCPAARSAAAHSGTRDAMAPFTRRIRRQLSSSSSVPTIVQHRRARAKKGCASARGGDGAPDASASASPKRPHAEAPSPGGGGIAPRASL